MSNMASDVKACFSSKVEYRAVIRYLYLKICPANKSQITNSFLLNIAEHELFSANKYENANKSWHFHIY